MSWFKKEVPDYDLAGQAMSRQQQKTVAVDQEMTIEEVVDPQLSLFDLIPEPVDPKIGVQIEFDKTNLKPKELLDTERLIESVKQEE